MAYDPTRPGMERSAGNGHGTHEGFAEDPNELRREARLADAELDRSRSAGALVRQLIGDVAVLFRKELALAASEVGQSVDEAKRGATSMITGGAVLYAGVLFLLGGLTLWLGTMMAIWAAALIVGAVVAVFGFILVQTGKKHVKPASFTPERTMESLRKDQQTIERQVS